MGKRGFTLIELLVVIAIIAILAAILFPVFISAKERGRQATCCNNLKQLTQAMFNYADDNDGFLPICSRRHMWQYGGNKITVEWTGTQWTQYGTPPLAIDVRQGSLYKGGYARSVRVFNCPSDQDIPCWIGGYYSASDGKYGWSIRASWPTTIWINTPHTYTAAEVAALPAGLGISYSVNQELADKFPPSGCTTIKLATATAGRSAQILFLIHETRGSKREGVAGQNDGIFVWPGDYFDKIHWDGTTCSYADGHVRWLSNKEMARIEAITTRNPWWRNSHYYGMANWNYYD